MVKLPIGIDIHNLIDDLRNFSWEASEILIYYSQMMKNPDSKNNLIKSKNKADPVTLADLKVNETIINRINDKYKNIDWEILSEENAKIESSHSIDIKKWRWVLDPLDGTRDFIQNTGNYAVHLALIHNQKPFLGIVLIPEKGELWITNGYETWCENINGQRLKLSYIEKKDLRNMVLVTSKNHRNPTLEKLIKKINFKKVVVMGSIGCKIASIIKGESDIYISLSLPGQSCPKDWDFAAPEAILKNAGGKITNIDNEELIYNKKNYEQGGIIIASNDANSHENKCMQIKEIIKRYDLYPLS